MTNVKNKTAIAIVTVMMLALSIATLPAVYGAKLTIRPSDAGMSFSWDPIGVGQPQRVNCKFSGAAPFVGYKDWSALPGAYCKYTRPDGTQFNYTGPIYYNWEPGDGSSTSYTHPWTVTPDQVGTWIVEFIWPGDVNYNSYSVKNTFNVQQAPVDILRESNANLFFRPNPIGVGQELLVEAWVTPRPLTVGETFTNYYITFTKPDGTTAPLGPFESFAEGSIWFTYVVDKVGNWTVRFTWAGDEYNTPVDITLPLTVQEEPIPSWPAAPLPTEPWYYPINCENREWYTISGPWFHAWGDTARTSFNLYSEAPLSSHILFSLPPYAGIGGIIGGDYGTGQYYTVSPIQFGTGTGGAIMAGNGYWCGDGNIHCFDMHTGEEVWSVPGAFDFGAIENGQPELVRTTGTRLIKVDAFTGATIANITGIIGSTYRNFDTSTVDVLGGYVLDIQTIGTAPFATYKLIKWSFWGSDTNFTNRIAWNVTWPFTGPDPTNVRGATIDLNLGIASWITYPAYGDSGAVNYTDGSLLWARPLTNIQARNAHGVYNGLLVYPSDDRTVRALDLITGKEVWISEKTEYPWGTDFAYSNAAAYGLVYKLTYAGAYAFNATNGKIVWHFSTGDSGMETPYGTWPTYDNVIGANDVLFFTTTEHSPTTPYYRGQHLFAVDANTGEEIWRIKSTIAPAAVADGVLLASDLYDGRLYAFSKGPTATTLSLSSEVIEKGSSILLKGTVLDMSPAQNGTAAVSEDSMSEWMEYLHMQQPFPQNATGVEVSLDTLDPNNNYVHIGTATTDLTGQYSFLWQPEIEGKYTIVASFNTNNAYYGSTAETSLGVTLPTSAPTEQPQVAVDNTPILYAVIGLGIAIVLAIAIATLLITRKRP